MEIVVRLPQLDEVIAKLDELLNVVNNVDTVGANTGSDIELCVKTLLAFGKKFDDLTLTAAAPGAVAQAEVPSQPKQPKAERPKRRRILHVEHVGNENDEHAGVENGEDAEVEDEDALRARVEFEAKRTTRQFGISGTRAAISRVADGVLRVDDVPATHLAAVLSALQAL